MENTVRLELRKEWDKTFPKSEKVNHRKVTFPNRYGITLAADLYEPKGVEGKLAAIAVCGPFGAVKEQAAGLYAQTMAERGFLTIAFDPSFTGESGGTPRYMASPDINTEDFQAAVDFLSVQENVDPERIGIIGICGWGGLALNAAALDTRIKATAASTMYDMSRVNANGYFDGEDSADARYAKKEAMNAQRLVDYKNGSYAPGGGVVDPLPEDAPFFVADYHDYYKTDRGYHKRSLNSNGGWNVIGCMSVLYPLDSYFSNGYNLYRDIIFWNITGGQIWSYDVLGGDVYFGLAESYQIRCLAATIRRFKDSYPDLHYHNTSGDTEQVTEKPDKGIIDFAVLAQEPNTAKYHYLEFAD